METFEEYISQIENPGNRARMRAVLSRVAEKFPNLTPRIAWNQPMFTDHGTFIIGFSASKHHLAAAPEIAGILRFSGEIHEAGYEHTKELIRFPWDRPVDYDLLERIITFNILDKVDVTTFWRK
jgi:uncharacterized protein YdhG (YjbR/CyaY superfamily)